MGIALAPEENHVVFIPCQKEVTEGYLREQLTALNRDELCKLNAFDMKSLYDMVEESGEESMWRGEAGGQDVMRPYRAQRYFDILIAAYLINPLKSDYQTEDIASEYLSLTIPDRTQVCGKGSFAEAYEKNPEEFAQYACYQAYVCLAAGKLLRENLVEQGMDGLFYEIEMPLSRVLHDMECYGVLVQPAALKAYGEALTGRITELEQAIYRQADCNFNINSPKQLAEILFEKMGIKGGKKTKTGYSTAADVLEKLAPDYRLYLLYWNTGD